MQVTLSAAVVDAIRLHGPRELSIDAILRNMLSLPPRSRSVKVTTADKYPLSLLAVGAEVVIPWPTMRDGQRCTLGGLKAYITRQHRTTGRRYQSFGTSSGLQVRRIA